MKLPSTDDDLREDEIEGLVSSPVSSPISSPIGSPSHGSNSSKPNPSLYTRKSSAWLSSKSVGKHKKLVFIFGLFLIVFAMVGLNHSDSTAIDNNDTNSVGNVKTPKIDIEDDEKANATSTEDDEEDVNDEEETGADGDSESANKKDDNEGSLNEVENEVDDKGDTDNIQDGDKDAESEEASGESEPEPEPEPDADEVAKKEALVEKWGKWHFWDGDPNSRPTADYMAVYPNRDCPFDDFPETAWQADAVYVNHMLDSAGELVTRAKEAIYTEYGFGPREELDHDQIKERMGMFRLHLIDLEDENIKEPKESLDQGGWTTKRSLDGLARRLMHAMMTNDTFTIVLGGHSAAAGHGNHFLQSYMMQMHKVLEPIFTRVGVKLVVRNLAQGGLGTLQSALGSGSIYGGKVDMIVWDSAMTEKDHAAIDLFYRQAMIGGERAPILWGGPFELLKDLYLHADADVMVPGSAMSGIKETTDEDQAKTLPFAARFMKCSAESHDLCNAPENRFRALCWIDRDDVTPVVEQRPVPRSQVSWHPGFRVHQLMSRSMAFTILTGLQDAIDTWSEHTIFEGHPLQDDHWHVTNYYENIRSKVMNLDSSVGACNNMKEFFPERICKTPMKGRTEFTPRANPDETSLMTIFKPAPDGWVPELKEKMLYEGPDVPNPLLMVPEGEIDVEAIVSNRRLSDVYPPISMHQPSANKVKSIQPDQQHLRGRNLETIQTGKGWQFHNALPGNCDGTSTGICGRLKNDDCLMYGHMDQRGGILGNALSGWFVVTLPQVTAGLVIVKFESWHLKGESKVTAGWTEVNNGQYNRDLKAQALPLPEDFMLDYAIDGKITTLNLTQFQEVHVYPQRVVETLVLLDDPDMKETKDLEVAIRLRNCGRECIWSFTHVYWS